MKGLLKLVLKYLPFKKQLFSVLKVFNPSESVWKHLYFKGIFSVSIKNSGSFKMMHYGFQLENELFWSGLQDGWEKESMNLWISLVKDAKVILDIGANTGVYALVAKTVNPDAAVYAFEPVQRVYEKLEDNVKLNAYNIHCSNKAVSDHDGVAVFYDLPTDHVYSVTLNKNLNDTGVSVIETKVQTIMLDTFLEEAGITDVDLVKIDVETHEPEVLAGFVKGLAHSRPTLLIEILNEEVGERVEALVRDYAYEYYNIDEKGGIRKTEHIGKSDYYNYLLCNKEQALKMNLKR